MVEGRGDRVWKVVKAQVLCYDLGLLCVRHHKTTAYCAVESLGESINKEVGLFSVSLSTGQVLI